MIEVVSIRKGAELQVLALRKPGASLSHVEEYIAGLPERDRKKLVKSIERLAERGPLLRNPEKYEWFGDHKLGQIKEKPHRILWFYAQHGGKSSVVLASAFRKKSDRTPRAEIARAIHRREQYFEQFGA